jgi:hypothetical protein
VQQERFDVVSPEWSLVRDRAPAAARCGADPRGYRVHACEMIDPISSGEYESKSNLKVECSSQTLRAFNNVLIGYFAATCEQKLGNDRVATGGPR